MTQPFTTEEFKIELERSLGFRLSSLLRLDGASALNFMAVRESDGMKFAVKCSPPERQQEFNHLVRHLKEMRGTKAVARMFERELPMTFRGFNLICMSWCDGVRVLPDKLSDAQFLDFIDEFYEFSSAMQKTTLHLPAYPIIEWRRRALESCRGVAGYWLRRMIARELPMEEMSYSKKLMGVVHGDFHHGNFLFVNGRVNGFFDLEEFREGYPAEDIVRYIVCAAEHLRWYELWRQHAMLKRFAAAVRRLPYSADEWLVAINGLFVRKVYKKICRNCHFGRGGVQTINLVFRARFYGKMKHIVRGER